MQLLSIILHTPEHEEGDHRARDPPRKQQHPRGEDQIWKPPRTAYEPARASHVPQQQVLDHVRTEKVPVPEFVQRRPENAQFDGADQGRLGSRCQGFLLHYY